MGIVLEEIFFVKIVILLNEEKDFEMFLGLIIKCDGIVVWNLDCILLIIDIMVLFFFIFVVNVVLKDVVFDFEIGIWGWVFFLELVFGGFSEKLLIVVYFYGGGFCMGNVGNGLFEYYCFFLCFFYYLLI